MALRSQEEVSLATVFARALRGVIALTTSEEKRVWPDAGEVLRATPAEAVAPASLVRLLQFAILPEILGESAGPAIYLASKRTSRGLGITSIQGLKDWFSQMRLGDLEVELDEERVLVKLSRCLSCQHLKPTGTPVCDVERGIIDGVLEGITGTEVLTKETMCWGLGDTVCQFEGYAGPQAVGYLYHENGFHPDEQRRLLSQLADQADVALDNLRLLHERREHETHDPLTGLLNFRQLRERAVFELARAERHGRQVAFVMIDLDDFAAVNETAGREAGDEVLRHWAAALTAQLRSCDIVCRYGADEFLAHAPRDRRPGGRRGARARARCDAGAGRRDRRPRHRPFRLRRHRQLPRRRAQRRGSGRQGGDDDVHGADLGAWARRVLLRSAAPLTRVVAARVELLVVGSLHRDLASAAQHYVDLLKPHMTVSVREVKEVPLRGRSEAEVLREEGRRLLAAWPQAPAVSALAIDGARAGLRGLRRAAAARVRARRRRFRDRRLARPRGRGPREGHRDVVAVGAHSAAPAGAGRPPGAAVPRRQDPPRRAVPPLTRARPFRRRCPCEVRRDRAARRARRAAG